MSGLYIKGIIGLALLLLIGGLYQYGHHEHARAEKLNGQLAVAKDQISRDNIALQEEQNAVAELTTINKDWAQKCALNPQVIAAAQSQIDTLSKKLGATRAALFAAEEKDRVATPACAFLLSTDLAAVCPDVAQQLRQLPPAAH